MKKIGISLIIVLSMLLTSCGGDFDTIHNLIGKKMYITDTSAIISLDNKETFKITDTTIFNWPIYLFIYGDKDTTEFKREVFYVYDVGEWHSRYSGGTYLYLTNGKYNLKFEGPVSWIHIVKQGDKFYCFYKIGSCFKSTSIK